MNTQHFADPTLTMLILHTNIFRVTAEALNQLPADHPYRSKVLDLHRHSQSKLAALPSPGPVHTPTTARSDVPHDPADPMNRRAIFERAIVTKRGSVIHAAQALGIATASARAYMHRYLSDLTEISKENGRIANAAAHRARAA